MSFKTKTIDDLVNIAYAGGGFRLEANSRTTDDLVRIAYAAQKGGSHVVFSGLSYKTTEDLVRIGYAGKSAVTLED